MGSGFQGYLAGCLVRYNRYLLDVDMPYSFECTMDWRIESASDVAAALEEAVVALSGLLSSDMSLGAFRHWEYIGRRFNLYSFSLIHSGREVGIIRLVESGGYLVNVTGILRSGAEPWIDSLYDVREQGVVRDGDNLEEVVLRRISGAPGAPMGQKFIPNFVIYAVEGIPKVNPKEWRLVLVKDSRGSREELTRYSYDDLAGLSRDLGVKDFHCVTGWSVKGKRWGGIRLADLVKLSGSPGFKWVLFKSVGGYTTILPADDALDEDTMVVLFMDGRELPLENGFPARIASPKLYGWKGAKWLSEVILLDEYQDGLWEALSYHERGRVSLEERFKIRSPFIAKKGFIPGRPRMLKIKRL